MSDRAPAMGRAAAPWHFWAISVASLLWNGFGGYDYVMTRQRDMAYLAKMAGSPAKAQEMMAIIDAFPPWASAAWAIGVWGSVLGSLLLLARSRHTASAFLISLAGAVVSFAYQHAIGTPAAWAMEFVIIGAVLALWWYARLANAKGYLS